jgi:hypothetical protein
MLTGVLQQQTRDTDAMTFRELEGGETHFEETQQDLDDEQANDRVEESDEEEEEQEEPQVCKSREPKVRLIPFYSL